MANDPLKAAEKAQSVLDKAKQFTKAVEGTSKSQFAPKAAPVKKASPIPVAPKPTVRAQNIAVANEEAAKYGMKGVPIMHDGGKVKKDGPVILKKGETVRTPDQEKKVQDKMKKSKTEEVMTKAEKDKPKAKKDGKKKKHVHKIEIEKKKGGYLVRTHSKPAEGEQPATMEGPEESVHPDLASVTNHLNENMGPDEEEQEPGAGAGAPPPAAPQE
jgi:hypothetical protein